MQILGLGGFDLRCELGHQFTNSRRCEVREYELFPKNFGHFLTDASTGEALIGPGGEVWRHSRQVECLKTFTHSSTCFCLSKDANLLSRVTDVCTYIHHTAHSESSSKRGIITKTANSFAKENSSVFQTMLHRSRNLAMAAAQTLLYQLEQVGGEAHYPSIRKQFCDQALEPCDVRANSRTTQTSCPRRTTLETQRTQKHMKDRQTDIWTNNTDKTTTVAQRHPRQHKDTHAQTFGDEQKWAVFIKTMTEQGKRGEGKRRRRGRRGTDQVGSNTFNMESIRPQKQRQRDRGDTLRTTAQSNTVRGRAVRRGQ